MSAIRIWYPFTFTSRTQQVYRVSFRIAEEATWDHRYHDLQGTELSARSSVCMCPTSRASRRPAMPPSALSTSASPSMRVSALRPRSRASSIAARHVQLNLLPPKRNTPAQRPRTARGWSPLKRRSGRRPALCLQPSGEARRTPNYVRRTPVPVGQRARGRVHGRADAWLRDRGRHDAPPARLRTSCRRGRGRR